MSQPLQVPQLLLMSPQNQYQFYYSQIPNNLVNSLLVLQNQKEILHNVNSLNIPNTLLANNTSSLPLSGMNLSEQLIPQLNSMLLQKISSEKSTSERESSILIDNQIQSQSNCGNILQVLPNQLPISLMALNIPQVKTQNQQLSPSDSKILAGISVTNIAQQLNAQNLSQQAGCSNFTQQLGQILSYNQNQLNFLKNFQNIQNGTLELKLQDQELYPMSTVNKQLVQGSTQQFGFQNKTTILTASLQQQLTKEESQQESSTYAEEEVGYNENDDGSYQSGDMNSNKKNAKQQEDIKEKKQNRKQNSNNNKIQSQLSQSKEITIKQEHVSIGISSHSAKVKQNNNSIQSKSKKTKKCPSKSSSQLMKQQKLTKKRNYSQLQETNSSAASASTTQNNSQQKIHTKLEDTELFQNQPSITQSNSLIKYDSLSNQNNSLSITKQPSNYDSAQCYSSYQTKAQDKFKQNFKIQKKQFCFSSSNSSSSQDEEMNIEGKNANSQGNIFSKLEKEEMSEDDVSSSIENSTGSINDGVHFEDEVKNYQSVKKYCRFADLNTLTSCDQNYKSQIIIVCSLKPKEKVKKSKQDYYNDSNYTKNLLKGFRRYMKRFSLNLQQFDEFDKFFDSHQLNNELILKLFSHDEYQSYFNKFLSQSPDWWIQEAKIKDVEKQVSFFNLCKSRKFTSIKTKRKSFKRPQNMAN